MDVVLVVDDDPEVLRFIGMALSSNGVKTIQAQSSGHALQLYQRRHNDIRLVLTDITMPEVSGIELSIEIGKLNPNLQIVFMTGDKVNHRDKFAQALEGREILSKPFTPAELLQVVNKSLRRAKTASSH